MARRCFFRAGRKNSAREEEEEKNREGRSRPGFVHPFSAGARPKGHVSTRARPKHWGPPTSRMQIGNAPAET